MAVAGAFLMIAALYGAAALLEWLLLCRQR